MLRLAAVLILVLAPAVLAPSALAQSADERALRWPLPRSAAHPGLLGPANDLHQRAAFNNPFAPQLSRAWYLEARTGITARPATGCDDCGDPVRRRNHNKCDRCDARWRKLAQARWDFPLAE